VRGVRWLVVFAGVNDIGTTEPTGAATKQVAADLMAAYEQIIIRAHARGIRVCGATLTPFGGNVPYDDAQGCRTAARQEVNAWLRGVTGFTGLDSAAGVPGWWRVLLVVIAVVGTLWLANATVITSLFAFRAVDVARLAAYFLGKTPLVLLGNAGVLIAGALVIAFGTEPVAMLLAAVGCLALLMTSRPMIEQVRERFTA
jgi:hypothetical protein